MAKTKVELVERLTVVDAAIEKGLKERQQILQSIAEMECPYKVGDRLKTNKGLGTIGLLVDAVTFTGPHAKEGNWWQVNTFAISKAGEVTRRNVGISQYEAEHIMTVEKL